MSSARRNTLGTFSILLRTIVFFSSLLPPWRIAWTHILLLIRLLLCRLLLHWRAMVNRYVVALCRVSVSPSVWVPCLIIALLSRETWRQIRLMRSYFLKFWMCIWWQNVCCFCCCLRHYAIGPPEILLLVWVYLFHTCRRNQSLLFVGSVGTTEAAVMGQVGNLKLGEGGLLIHLLNLFKNSNCTHK